MISARSSRARRRLSVALRCLAATAVVGVASFAGAPTASAQGPLVNGGGSSFVSLLVAQWRADVAKPPYNLGINYAATGSTFGRDKYITGALDFGQSDIQFLDDEQARLQKSGRQNFVYVPVAAGAVAFMFNLAGTDGKRITDLNLTTDAACKIFTVPNIKWNDPSIASTNPGAKLPDRPVIPVVRQDRSGTSYVLSEFCIRRAPAVWNAFRQLNAQGSFNPDERLGRGLPITQWSTGYGKVQSAQASDGIANAVGTTADTVTYIETGFTKVKRLPAAKVQNPAGVFTPPLPANSTVALGFASPRGNGTFELSYDGGDPRAYFPSTYSYAIAQTTGFDPAKGKVLASYLNYAACKGQEQAEPLLYSRLSTVLVDIALDAIAKIPGAPPRPPTATCSAPPPPSLQNAPAKAAGAAAPGAAGGPGAAAAAGAAGAGAGAAAAADQAAAAAAADAAAADAAAAQGAEVAGATEEAAADAAASGGASGAVAGQNVGASSGGPENSDVLFTLLLGAALVAVGTFAAKGGRSAVGGS